MKSLFKYLALATTLSATTAVPYSQVAAQSGGLSNSQTLQDALRRIARNSKDSSALADAGLAALELGDTRAAIGFLARADQIYPRSGRVKAGLARALLLEENPFGALRYFDQALKNGVTLQSIAAERGLAYDLIGRNADAQKDYLLAMRQDDSDDLRSLYAVSLGISGDMEKAEIALNPLLQKSDRDAWRNRAFLLAMNGKTKDANAIARQTMQPAMANAVKPFFDRMSKLTAAQKAAAVHLGHFPASENIGVDVEAVRYASNTAVRGGDGADAGLIPLGEPLGEEVKKPRVLAMPDTSVRRRPGRGRNQKVRRVTQRELRRMQRRGVKYKILSESELPAPVRAKSSKKKRSTKPVKSVKAQKASLPTVTKIASSSKIEKPAAVSSSNKKTVVLQTKTALSAETNSKETKIAAVEKPAITPPVVAAEKAEKQVAVVAKPTPKPLVSETVERKVAIGDVSVSKTVQTITKPVQEKVEPVQKEAVVAVAKAVTAPEQKSVPVPVTPPSITENLKPVELASFDLAKAPLGGNAPVQAQSTQLAQADVESKSLSDIIKTISIPESERAADVVPVDLRKIVPAKKQDKAKPEPKEKPKKVEPKKEEHPKRYWVQIATGSNLNALKYDYRRLVKKNNALFGDKTSWTSPWGRTRRLVVGPFENLKDAKKFEAGFRKAGGNGFAWISSKGTVVKQLTK